MPSMPPKDTSMLDWNRNKIKIRKNQTLFFVSTNSKPDPYLGLKDHTDHTDVIEDRRFHCFLHAAAHYNSTKAV